MECRNRAADARSRRETISILFALTALLLAAGEPAPAARGAGFEQASELSQEARQLYRQGAYAKAARTAEKVVQMRAAVSGPEHPKTAESLLLLAISYQGLGQYEKALSAAERALAIDKQALGQDHIETARALHVVAEVYRAMGRHNEALPLAKRSLAIREKAVGPHHPDTAQSLHSLAELYRSLGQYAKALPLARRALSIREETLGLDHEDTAESLNDLGLAYFGMGDSDRALSLCQRALEIRNTALGRDHPLTGESLNNLAALRWSRKEYQRALALFKQALEVKEKSLGPYHPATAASLNNLAEVYRSMGNDAKALSLLQRVVAIWGKALGPEHPHTLKARSNLAGFFWKKGDYAKARPMLQSVAATWEKRLGPGHPETARALNLLAAFHQSTGEYRRALSYYRRGLPAEDRALARVFAVASEEEELEFLERTQGHYLAALSLIHRRFRNDDAAVRFGLELVLHRKGIVLDAQARRRRALATHLSGETLRSWEQLTKHRAELAKLLLAGPVEQSIAEYRRSIRTLQGSIREEEQLLNERSGTAAGQPAWQRAGVDTVARHLPRDGVLVEFVALRDWDEAQLAWASTSRYLAFVLTADSEVTLLDLGDTGRIDAAVDAALNAINDPTFLNDVTACTRKVDADLGALYDRILRPVDAAVGARKQLIVSPDGAFYKVPFAALRTPDGHYLVEGRTVSYVASGRDLTRAQSSRAPALSLWLAANPAFDDRSVLRTGRRRARSPLRAADYHRTVYPPLPATAAEARIVASLVHGEKRILVGKEATESAVLAVKSPRILHLATHGFFLRDTRGESVLPDPLGRKGYQALRGGAAGPMVRAGLAFAGANYASEIADGNDGILTALELSQMDLQGTDLVVLSACDTALGAVKVGEGVYGLRRAFVLAGARNLVMSLWPVADKITEELMERFYRAYGHGMEAAEALRVAELKTIRALRQATRASRQGEALAPVNLWAPFIVQQAGTAAGAPDAHRP